MPEIGMSGSMSGDGKRGVAERPKLPRPSSTLPNPKCRRAPQISANRRRADALISFYDPRPPRPDVLCFEPRGVDS
jgi:hypothetical protein